MRTKIKKYLKNFICISFIFVLLLSAVSINILAADTESRNNAIKFSDYSFQPIQSGVAGPPQFTYAVMLHYTSSAFYGGIDSDTVERWNRPVNNQQYDMYSSVYVPGINFWQITAPTVINKINALTSDDLFIEYKNKFLNVFDAYYSAMRSMDSSLLCQVNDNNVTGNNQNLNAQKSNIDNAKKLLQELEDNIDKTDYTLNLAEQTKTTTTEIIDIPEAMWDSLGAIIGVSSVGNSEVFGLGLDTINTVANNLLPYITGLAYLVVIVSFGLSASESALRMELYEPRGAVTVLMRLAFAKALIDVSINLSLQVIKIINNVASGAVTNGVLINSFSGSTLSDLLSNVININNINSGTAILSFLLGNIPNIVITIVIIVSLIQVLIKLVMRNFELGCLLCVAPVGFATLGGETTKKYFTKYFGALIGAASQILVIAISYNLVSYWLSNTINDGTTILFLGGEWVSMIIICAMGKFVSKPPAGIQNIFVFT